jgi:hypothetical protein
MSSVGGGIRNIPIIPITLCVLAGPRDRFFRVIFQSSAAMYALYNKYVILYRVCINHWTIHAYDICCRGMHVLR